MNALNDVEILLVEDNNDDAELTIRALKKRNLANNLARVSDGAAALDFIFSKGTYSRRQGASGPKVVLLDLKLPKVDGVEVLRTIRQDPRTARLPVVVLTSSREEKDIVDTYRLGVNSYIVKPVDFEKFMDAVSTLGLYWLLLNQSPAGRQE
jgi:CheY-like chemotaxis protein